MNTIAVVGLKHLKDVLINNQTGSVCMENHEEIISRLKFIGYIQRDEKINVRHVNRQQNNFITKISRSFIYPDNRINALKFVKDVVTRSFEIVERYNSQGNTVVPKGIVSDLIKAKQGIQNLKFTYNEDTKFGCDMDVVMENIDSKILELKNSNPELFKESEEQNSEE